MLISRATSRSLGVGLADSEQASRAGMVLSFAGINEAQIAQALEKLRRAWR